MPYRLCPVCRNQGRWLEGLSEDAYVTFFRCDQCGTVWVYDPANVQEPIRIVMSRPPPRD